MEATLLGEPGWKPTVPAVVSCSASPLFSTSPSSWNFLQPVHGTFPTSSWSRIQINQSLQEWAEHFHPRQELMKYTSSGFAFIWQLFSGTTRFYPEKEWFDLSQNSVKSREHPPCSRYWTDPGILSAAPRKSICCRSVTNLTSKMVTKIITPNFWCAPIIQWNSLFKVAHQMSICYLCSEYLLLAGHVPLGRSWSWQRISLGTLFTSHPNDHIFHSLLLKCQLTGSQDCLATQQLLLVIGFWRNFFILGIPKKIITVILEMILGWCNKLILFYVTPTNL